MLTNMERMAYAIAGGVLALFVMYAVLSTGGLLNDDNNHQPDVVAAQLKDLTVAMNQLRGEISMLKQQQRNMTTPVTDFSPVGINPKDAKLYTHVDKALVDYFPKETLLGDPERIMLVSNASLRSIDSYPMCKHPVWGKACDLYREEALSGQWEVRMDQYSKRESQPKHSMCPTTAKAPIILQLRKFCMWGHVMHIFKNTGGCPVNCQVVNDDTPRMDANILLDHCTNNPRPNTPSIWGSIALEWNEDGTLSVPHLKAHDIQVNWVRQHSDVYINYMYAWMQRCGHPKDYATSPCKLAKPTKQDLKQRELAVMFISKCNGHRLEYAMELSRWVLELSNGARFITSLGACNRTPNAPVIPPNSEGKVQALKKYKFHLSFENSIRPDYFTEKLQENALANTLGVVWAAPHAEDFAPGGAGSFINALEFDSPQTLAKRMLELDGDDDVYLRYFDWRIKPELNPQFVAQAKYNLENAGEQGFACRTCMHYLNRFCQEKPKA